MTQNAEDMFRGLDDGSTKLAETKKIVADHQSEAGPVLFLFKGSLEGVCKGVYTSFYKELVLGFGFFGLVFRVWDLGFRVYRCRNNR